MFEFYDADGCSKFIMRFDVLGLRCAALIFSLLKYVKVNRNVVARLGDSSSRVKKGSVLKYKDEYVPIFYFCL